MLSSLEQNHLLDRITILDCKFNAISNCDKKTFIGITSIFNHKLILTKNVLIEQIYILNRLYDKQIGNLKKQMDNYIENFVHTTSFDKKRNNFYSAILTSNYNHLMCNIKKFYNLEKIVKQNLQNYNKAVNEYSKYLDSNIMNYNLNNDTITKIVPKYTLINQPIPSVQHCKDDIDKKISYINRLYKETTQKTQNEQKGDYYGN